MKKYIRIAITAIYLILIITTIALFVHAAIPREGALTDDKLGNSMAFVIGLFLCGPIVLAEADLFYNSLYFVSNRKTTEATVFNIILSVISIFMIFSVILIDRWPGNSLATGELLILITVGLYLALRAVYIVRRSLKLIRRIL